ncbi:PilW family protein [Peristeroidobacter soli]|uniref:PilW family protein n=1 Tax=Peristeroidobacter soli TaxID=2497877 RepID=UPI00101C9956|nr:PilW family protein [Peristeroidobacter soli]
MPTPSKHSVQGFSVLELMVAMAISLLLLMGVIALFVSSRQSYETTERLSRIQENGRFALDQMVNDARAAGFQGCSRAVNTSRRVDYAINRLNSSNLLTWNFGLTTQGFEGATGTFVPALDAASVGISPEPNAGGDVLVLRIPRREAQTMYTVNSAGATAPLEVANVTPAPFEVGDTVMVTDCEARAWFSVTSYAAGVIGHAASGAGSRSPGNVDGDLFHPFRAFSQIVPVDTIIYYLARSSQYPDADPVRLSLYRRTGNAAVSDEIADGIDRLEVQYGIDAGGGAISYVDASGVTNWDNVLTVQIAVLARAPEAYGTDLDTQEYVLFSSPNLVTTEPYNDRFQRKVFTATVGLRNQIID